MKALAWLGRQGPRAVAALVFIAIALPPLGALLKPYLTPVVFILLCVSFIKLEPALLCAHLGRPGMVFAAMAWTMLLIPALFGLVCVATGLETASPELFLALLLQGVASPMMSGPALASLIGLDSTLVLITLVSSTLLVPLSAPLFAWFFAGSALTLSPLALGAKLFVILGGAALLGVGIRYVAGAQAIERYRHEINGLNVLMLFVFAAAIMENVAASIFTAPLVTAGLVLLAFAIFFALLALTMLVFARAGCRRAFALAFTVSQRNMGLMLAGTGGALPELTWLYFALGQFPIYLAPQLLGPLARRLGAADGPPPGEDGAA